MATRLTLRTFKHKKRKVTNVYGITLSTSAGVYYVFSGTAEIDFDGNFTFIRTTDDVGAVSEFARFTSGAMTRAHRRVGLFRSELGMHQSISEISVFAV